MTTPKDGLELEAAPQDISRPILEGLLAKGYTDTLWNTSASATDAPCVSRDGDQMPLEEFITGLQHDAPIYEKTHVGCTCSVRVSGEGLQDVIVNAFGLGAGPGSRPQVRRVSPKPTRRAPKPTRKAPAPTRKAPAPTRKAAPKPTPTVTRTRKAPAPTPKATPKRVTRVSKPTPTAKPLKVTKVKKPKTPKKVTKVSKITKPTNKPGEWQQAVKKWFKTNTAPKKVTRVK